MRKVPAILCILDGFGLNQDQNHNAIAKAITPTFNQWSRQYKMTEIGTDGSHVGLPQGQMGNSEVGHMNIGAGQIALPEFGRIDTMLNDGTLIDNLEFQSFIQKTLQANKMCHIMGLVSNGGVHAHQDQIAGFAKLLSQNGIAVKVHVFTDGRDTPPQSAMDHLNRFIEDCSGHNIEIVTISGRFFAMDRDQRWERIQAAYDVITLGKSACDKLEAHSNINLRYADSIYDAIQQAYDNNETDEFISPTIIGNYSGIENGDSLFMANFRADRVRQILSALLETNFDAFDRKKQINFATSLGAVKYADSLLPYMDVLAAPLCYPDGLGEHISKLGLKQLRLAETEKFAHVTFFFNGGIETPFEGEDRILVPSPKVKTYDEQPEMAAFDVKDHLIQAIESKKYDVIIVNFANADMVGHTGDENAAIKAIETLDQCMAEIEAALSVFGGFMMVTADHGNAELMRDPITNVPHTQHTTFPVPLYIVDPHSYFENYEISSGKLADLAPTMLSLMGYPISDSMTGKSLIHVCENSQ